MYLLFLLKCGHYFDICTYSGILWRNKKGKGRQRETKLEWFAVVNSAEMATSTFIREITCSGDIVLEIKQLYIGDVGCVVWDAALVLAKFLENGVHFERDFWKGKRVIDIGSGTGVVGLAAGVLG